VGMADGFMDGPEGLTVGLTRWTDSGWPSVLG